MEFRSTNALVTIGSLSLGAATGFCLRDELNMPTYMRIKMSTIEHRMITRQKLSRGMLSLIDPNEGAQLMQERKA